MKKYFQIVNRVFLGLLILIILFHHRAPNAEAQFDGPMLDSGDGYGVMPGKNISPTSSAKFLKEAEKTINDIQLFELNVSSESANRNNPIPTLTSTTIDPSSNNNQSALSPNLTPSYNLNFLSEPVSIQLVSKIADSITNSCTQFGAGVVKKSNVSCVNNISNLIIERRRSLDTINHLKTSATTFNTLQCVGCARAMTEAVGRPYLGYGDAKQHANQEVSNYRLIYNGSLTPGQRAQIPPGSLFIQDSGTFGHIGMIVKVNKDSQNNATSFVVQECNWITPGLFKIGRAIPAEEIHSFQVPI
jgi:hypothetical protein